MQTRVFTGATHRGDGHAPEGLIGVHTNLLVPALNNPAALPADTEQENAALAAIKTFQTSGNGYFVEQSTRPQLGPSVLPAQGERHRT